MGYCDEDNGAAGSIPEFGAIFMSNIEMKKECFKHNILALPSSMAEFVKHVKAGMILFLFEYKRRQLFGVYRASSDGAMDIVPHAFNRSRMHLPAQVCFTPIWYCYPLSEHEFRDAIRENYFSAKKFNFGLSKDQVHRLLSLFSPRKLKNKLPSHMLEEVVVRVAGNDKGLVGDERFALSERGYMETIEYDEFNPAVFYGNSLTRSKEGEVFIDDVVNTEREEYALSQGDFLSKKRRIDNDDKLISNCMAEKGTFDHGNLWTLNEAREIANARRLLSAERVHNGNEVDDILNPVLSSEYPIHPLDARNTDDDRFTQRPILLDEYNMDNGYGQAFAHDHYPKPLNKSKHAINDDRFLFDDSVQRERNFHEIVKPMIYSDDKLNLCRKAREMMDDNRCLMNSKLGNRYHLDCDGSPYSVFEHSASLLHDLRKTNGGGTFPVNDRIQSKPNFGTCSVEDFSSENFSRPLHCGQRIVSDRKYPIVKGRATENMDDNIRRSTYLIRNSRCTRSINEQAVDDGRFIKSGRVDNEEDAHMVISPFRSMEYPSSSQQIQNLSSFPDKLLTEKRRLQLSVAHNFDHSRAKFDDATITRAVPYITEHPDLSHGYSASMAAYVGSSLAREYHPHHSSLGNFCSSKNKSSSYFSELKKSSTSLDITPEFGNKCLPTNLSGHRSSLPHKINSSFLNSNLSVHMDVNTSAPVNHRGSLFPKLSLAPRYSDPENTEREKRLLFAYPIKSSENHCAFDRNLTTASQHVSEHATRQDMDMLADKDFVCSEAKDISIGTYHRERDFASYESQYMNLKDNHKLSEAPDFDSNINRRSVFTRLTSIQESQVGKERNDSDFSHCDCCMDATADEVMEMLQHSNDLSRRKPRKLRVVGQPKHGESAVNGRQIQSHIKINHSTMDKKMLDDASQDIPESTEDVPKETRIMDFKRRRDTNKNVVRTSIDLTTGNKIIGDNQELESSTKTTLKRKKLVRPVFGKNEAAPDVICRHSRLPGQILDEDDKRSCKRAIILCEAEMANDNTRLNNVLTSINHQSMDGNRKEHSNLEEQKDFPSTGHELKEDEASEVGLQVGNAQVLLEEITQHKSSSMDGGRKEHSNLVEQKDLPSTGHELKEHEATNVDLQVGNAQVLLKETTQHKSFGMPTSGEAISKDIDATASSLNLEESKIEEFKLGAGCKNNFIEESKVSMLRSKRRIIRPNKIGMKPSQSEHTT